MRRLKQLSNTIRRWNKDLKESNEEERKAWIKEIDLFDKMEANNSITDLHIYCRTAIKSDLNQLALKDAQTWA